MCQTRITKKKRLPQFVKNSMDYKQTIGLVTAVKADFMQACYMVHEIPPSLAFF